MREKKKLISIFAALALAICISLAGKPFDVYATAKTPSDALNWLNSVNGQALDMDGAYGAQCVDLILAYYDFLGVSRSSGNGRDYASNALPSGWSRVQGGTPQLGDILVFGASSSNEYGHVCIYESDTVTWHQNFNNVQRVQRVTGIRYTGFSNPYWGYIRPNWNQNGVLDVNGLLDGSASGGLGAYGTCDVYINGSLVSDDCGDYYSSLAAGTRYEIKDIKAKNGYSYDGISSGSLTGTISSGATSAVVLKFNSCKLDVNGLLDGVSAPDIGSRGTFDVYINGVLVADNVNEYNSRAAKGADYEIRDIRAADGYVYSGPVSGDLTGTIASGTRTVVLGFDTVGTATAEWTYSTILPKNITPDYCDIEYKYTSTKVASSSPGAGWTKVAGSENTKYENSGSVYDSDFELSTSNTRVYVGSYYYHYCGASTGNNVEHYNDGVHTDYHNAGDVNQFYVSGGPWADDNDSRYQAYQIKWKSGQWADGLATCVAGRSAIWYRRYQYQNKVAVTYYTWKKTTDWLSTPDPSLTPSQYRYRLKDLSDPVISLAKVTEITPDGYTILCSASDDSGIVKLSVSSWTDTETESAASVVEVVPDEVGKNVELTVTIPVSDHGNERDVKYNTRLTVYDKVGNTAEYTGEEINVYIAALIRSVRKLTLPSNLKEIEDEAFEGATSFGEAVIPDTVERIGNRAFADCGRLVVIVIPDRVTDFGTEVFEGSSNTVIICSIDSAAASYAKEYGIPYFTNVSED